MQFWQEWNVLKLLGKVPPPSINGSDYNHIAKPLYMISGVVEDIITWEQTVQGFKHIRKARKHWTFGIAVKKNTYTVIPQEIARNFSSNVFLPGFILSVATKFSQFHFLFLRKEPNITTLLSAAEANNSQYDCDKGQQQPWGTRRLKTHILQENESYTWKGLVVKKTFKL